MILLTGNNSVLCVTILQSIHDEGAAVGVEYMLHIVEYGLDVIEYATVFLHPK